MRKLWGSRAIAALVAIALPGVASAQSAPPYDPAIDINNFEYSIGPKSFFTVDNADTADRKQLALDAVVTFMSRPFTVYTTDGDPNNPMITGERTQVVQSLTAAQLTGAYGINEKLQVGANLPVVFSLTGDGLNPASGTPSMTGVSVTGLGDLLLEGKYRLWRSQNGQLRVAGIGGVTVPTSFGSDDSQFIGDDLPSLRGRLAWTFSNARLALGATAGFIVRKPRTIYASTIGQQLTFGFGASVMATNTFSLIGEFYGRGGLESSFALDESPMEAIGGIRVIAAKSFAVTIGGGAGLDEAIGSPKARFFFSLGYAPDVRDSDGDGIQNGRDKCPLIPEDHDGFEDTDGCPDDDNDGDRRPDAEDKCPNEAEDLDGFDDDDGCPEPDNDADGVPDAVDKCPVCPEDKDGFEDDDGCPELDNDKDGVPDSKDKCPAQPETFNGINDDDGCPDTGGIELLKLDGDRLVVAKVPSFDKKGLTKQGDQIVAAMAGVMLAHDEVTKWLIALAQPSQADAQKLAQLVKDRLTKAGVTNADVLGAAGPAKIGGVVQERGEGGTPVCPAGMEAKQRPDMITPKATMQQKSVSSAPTVEPKQSEPAKTEEKKDSDEIEMEP